MEAGDTVDGYWPDDDEWLEATLNEMYEDGTFRIAWASDGSESDVPADYVRQIGGTSFGGQGEGEGLGPEMSAEILEQVLDDRRALPGYERLGSKREELPAFKQKEEVIDAVRDNQVVLLVGETGCGKSTQVPQIIIDSCPEARVLVMQPRKLAALTLAERVAQERCQKIGEDIGYQVPFGGKNPRGRLVFCTLGVFRRRLLEDTELAGITHVIFDEVHERDKLADFNMIFMRDLCQRRPDLKLMLMSATLQMETFERYFPGALSLNIPGRVYPVSELYLDEVVATLYKTPAFRKWLGPGVLCGGIDIPAGAEGDWNERAWKTVVFQHTKPEDRDTLWGLAEKGLESQMMAPMSKARLLDGLRKHDVLQQSSLAFDYPIIEALLLHIDRMYRDAQKKAEDAGAEPDVKPPGTVLVFLPGWGDIDQLNKRLSTNFDEKRFKILPLHSQVSPEQQNEIFSEGTPGIRKIVLTTNIAEASITVDGTEFIIDCGRAKEVSYDPYLRVGTLTTSWISQASAQQRAGRAGRTQGGLCFHLMCRERFNKLDEFLPPELLRSPLEDSALTAKLMLLQMGSKEKVSDFLMKAPDPPERMSVDNSIDLLVELGAFTKAEQLTALGQNLTDSTLPPRLAKTVLWAILLGCLDETIAIVCASAGFTRDPFRMGGMPREEAQKVRQDLAAPYNSDHACLLKVVQGFTDSRNQQGYCDKNHLVAATMRQIRDQQNKLFTELKENKTESFANRHRGSFELLAAVLCAGIFPNIARRRGMSDNLDAQLGKVEARAHGQSAYVPGKPDEWVFYQELSQQECNYKLKQVTPIDPLPLLLLGGEGPLNIEQGGKGGKGGKGGDTTVSLLDGWVKFRTDMATAQQVQKLRTSLQGAFQEFVQRPGDIPAQRTLTFLNQVVALISNNADAGDGAMQFEEDVTGDQSFGQQQQQGFKRTAPWHQGGGQSQFPRPSGGGFNKGGGKFGGGGGKFDGGKGGKGGFNGGGKFGGGKFGGGGKGKF